MINLNLFDEEGNIRTGLRLGKYELIVPGVSEETQTESRERNYVGFTDRSNASVGEFYQFLRGLHPEVDVVEGDYLQTGDAGFQDGDMLHVDRSLDPVYKKITAAHELGHKKYGASQILAQAFATWLFSPEGLWPDSKAYGISNDTLDYFKKGFSKN